jgi:hypothetical protein
VKFVLYKLEIQKKQNAPNVAEILHGRQNKVEKLKSWKLEKYSQHRGQELVSFILQTQFHR